MKPIDTVPAVMRRHLKSLADSIVKKSNTPITNAPRRATIYGVVTATASGPPVTVSVKVSGDTNSLDGIRCLASYVPVVGDTVMMEHHGTDLVVLGSLSASASTNFAVQRNLGAQSAGIGGAWAAVNSVTVSGKILYLLMASGQYTPGASDTEFDISISSSVSYSDTIWELQGMPSVILTPFALQTLWIAPDRGTHAPYLLARSETQPGSTTPVPQVASMFTALGIY